MYCKKHVAFTLYWWQADLANRTGTSVDDGKVRKKD